REAEALAHPRRVLAGAPPGGVGHLDELEHLLHARAGQAGERRERAQVIAPGAAWVHTRDLEVRAHRPRRIGQRRERVTEDRGMAGARPREAEEHAERGRLAGAVGTEESGDRAGPD